ncbi:MAG: PHB depolymerase family esterase [Gemmatimonadetes bacterium]|nr:PHB depolymerase family esterase [Gemmatimonadota bacterium]
MTADPLAVNAQALGTPAGVAPAAPAGAYRTGTLATGAGDLDYAVFVPAALPPAGHRALVVMLHGCTQDAADFARGTRVNFAAARDGFVVLWPQQRQANHLQKCWNWYVPQHTRRGSGEVERLRALIAATVAEHGVEPERVYLAGVSAGGAMALNYAAAYPRHVRALMVHSSPPALVADAIPSALAVMRDGPPEDAETLAKRVCTAMGGDAHAIPLLALHGADDPTVTPRNLDALAAQWRGWHALIGVPARVETQVIPGLAHAWSGGDASGSYTNPHTPSATAMMLAFFRSLGLPGKG